MWIATIVFAVLVLAALVAQRVKRFDAETGGPYTPGWTLKANYPKAYVHAVTAFALCSVMLAFRVPPPVAVVLTVLGGMGWEANQKSFGGEFNRYDVYADAIGAVAALLVAVFAQAVWPG